MKRTGLYCSLTSVLLLLFLSGCSTFPKPQSGAEGKLDPAAQAKLVEANSALDDVNEQSATFYAQLGPVLQAINQFCSRPGWNEFEQILLENPLLRDPDNEVEITPEIEARFAAWSQKWKTSWEEEFMGYRDLMDKCIILDARKLAARERLLVVQAKFLAAVMLELSAGQEKEAKEIYSVVDMLDKTGAELNSYQPDDLGLYRTSK